ncbi:MAG: polysaccharide biosynthesis protein [Spirochaetes bacterium]|jgi:FlaA1/EpsC-like NDP-sugar epimerase|nr:polysaccharide biosynthesis protein [Spirochaetota bacterium]
MKSKVLIYGAGSAGRSIAHELSRTSTVITGFIDDNPELQGSVIAGIPVLGDSSSIREVIQQYVITRFIAAIPSAHTEKINSALYDVLGCDREIKVQILPYVTRFFESPLINELEDSSYIKLIDREEISCDTDYLTHKYSGKTVLVTGAGGSIGSELCRMLLRLSVSRLICLGHGEGSIYSLSRSLEGFGSNTPVEYVIADVKDKVQLLKIMERFQPDTVFHAAAHKHVPLMETNRREACINNIAGTRCLLEVADKANVESFVFISTDKAVYPSSIMGATKRAGELLTLSFSGDMKCSVVRFGNVLGSRGSVIPLFNDQVERGGPVTITDSKMRRYFMTIPEAAILVIHAAIMNDYSLFILNMGREYYIQEIAENIIRSKCLIPGKDIKIIYTGLRMGEKLSEELVYKNEQKKSTGNSNIIALRPEYSVNYNTRNAIDQFLLSLPLYNENEIETKLFSVIKELPKIQD